MQPAVINDRLENVLMPFQLDWLYDNIAEADKILDYLDDNNDSQEAKAYVLNAIVRLANDNDPDVERMITALEIEDRIKADNLDLCPKTILEDLKELEENDIADIIYRFDNPTSNYDWEIKNGSLSDSGNSAETNWEVDSNNNAIDNLYLTIISDSYINEATNLAIARTILHEAVHAYIISFIDDFAGGDTQGFSTEFPDLWNNFVSKKYGVPADNIEDYQHQEMAQNFVDIIGSALVEYDNNRYDELYYEQLAWGSLMNTDAFSSVLGPGGYMTQSDQEAILIANNQKDSNGPFAKGSPCQ